MQKQAPGNVIIKTRSPPPTGHSHIYNFDEFYQQHYGAKLRQDIMYRKQYAQYEAKRDQKPENIPISIWLVNYMSHIQNHYYLFLVTWRIQQ